MLPLGITDVLGILRVCILLLAEPSWQAPMEGALVLIPGFSPGDSELWTAC